MGNTVIDDFLETHVTCGFLEVTRQMPKDKDHLNSEWKFSIEGRRRDTGKYESTRLIYESHAEEKIDGYPTWEAEYLEPVNALKAEYAKLEIREDSVSFTAKPIR